MLDAAACARLADVALRAHAMLGCEGYSRSDFILPFGEEEAVFLELNTLPGMTARSLLPLAARHDGIDFPTLCAWIATDGLRRGAPRRPAGRSPGPPPVGP
jgi:D-alanine-D-alanine ligase